MPANPLLPTVHRFVDEMSAALTASATATGGSAPFAERDVTTEAFNLCCAVIDSDGRHADDELWLLAATFGSYRTDLGLAGATPAVLRDAGLVQGKRSWLDAPSTLFEILVGADAADGGRRAARYIALTQEIMLILASIDQYPSPEEMAAIARHRSMLTSRAAVVSGPGTAPATGARPGVGSDAATAPVTDPTRPAEPTAEARPLEELMAELDGLVGLRAVKAEVHLLTNLIRVQQMRRERGMPTVDTSLHLVFTGNPGTGKTTVARLLAQIYRSIGALERGQLVETDRSGLVVGYVGQTAPQVVKRFDEADGGMLFIDEAYTLVRGGDNDFGREAIDQIVKLMEDRRDRVAVVVAGYVDEMADLIEANPGLRSRFPKTIDFPDYTDDELVAIFESICRKQQYRCDEATVARLRHVLSVTPRTKGFGNGRFVRNLFEAAVGRHATWVAELSAVTDDDLQRFRPDDLGPGPDVPPSPVPGAGGGPQLPSAP